MATAWKPLGALAAAKLAKSHLQPYQLAQWLARFARGYLEPVPDDSHTSLEWRRDLHGMTTKAAEIGGRRCALALDPRDLTLAALIDGEIADEISMHGRKDAEAGVWLRAVLQAQGFDPKALDAPSPYEPIASPYAQGAPYDSQKDIAGLAEMSRYLDNASLLLSEVADAHREIRPGPAPVRLWPHHFDIATIITLEDGDFETARAVGAGFAIPDKLHKEFYFYAYPWPRHERPGLPKLRSDCSYQYDGFFGAVQTMTKLLQAKDQEQTARAFFEETIGVFMDQLRREMAGE